MRGADRAAHYRCRRLALALLVGVVDFPFLASADATGEGATATDVRGTIMSADAHNQTLKIHHDSIAKLGWPEMTIDFYVANLAMLSEVYPGERVEFSFTQKDGRYVITEIGGVPGPL